MRHSIAIGLLLVLNGCSGDMVVPSSTDATPPLADASPFPIDAAPATSADARPADSCGPAHPNGACGVGDTCVAGACCANDQACGATCCSSGAVCVMDSAGNKRCASTCQDSTECPTATPCCTLVGNGMGGFTGNSVCSTGTTLCRCTTRAACGSGACAPRTDGNGDPVGPYVCKLNDGANYNGCHGITTCDSACCVTDDHDNSFCATECTDNSMCSPAHCNLYSFTFTSCDGPKACGP